jgi:hypothetical protein
VRSGDGRQFWQVRSPEAEKPQISELDALLKVGHGLKIEERDKLKKVRSEKIEGIDADCVQKLTAKGISQLFCFNANTGELVRHSPEQNSNTIP